ncbi:hypothetical protein RI054_44g153060 [Pseudoscourfieldia marina]
MPIAFCACLRKKEVACLSIGDIVPGTAPRSLDINVQFTKNNADGDAMYQLVTVPEIHATGININRSVRAKIFFLWLARTSRGALRAPLTNTFLGCAVPCKAASLSRRIADAFCKGLQGHQQ